MSKTPRLIAALLVAATVWIGATGAASAKATFDAACLKGVNAMAGAAAASGAATNGSAAGLDASVKALKAYAAKSPKDIRSDMTKLATAYGKAAKVLSQLKYDPASGKMPTPADMKNLEQAAKMLDTKELTAASARVQKWFATHCGGK